MYSCGANLNLCQVVCSGKFSEYSYRFVGNSGRYSSATPPEYDFFAIPISLPTLPVHGGNDAIGDPLDVTNLVSKLKGLPQILYWPSLTLWWERLSTFMYMVTLSSFSKHNRI